MEFNIPSRPDDLEEPRGDRFCIQHLLELTDGDAADAALEGA